MLLEAEPEEMNGFVVKILHLKLITEDRLADNMGTIILITRDLFAIKKCGYHKKINNFEASKASNLLA